MRFCPFLLAIGLLLPALGAHAASAAESCGVIVGTPPELVAAPALHVLSRTSSSKFALPAGLPDNVSAVVGSTPIPRTLPSKLIMSREECHGTTKKVQCGVQA